MQNMGDGSVAARFFKTEKAAEKYAERDDERNSDDISFEELEFDLNGNLIKEG
jgi:hypothetical protein